jgi:hypothetical protein
MKTLSSILLLVISLIAASSALAQTTADAQLVAEIAKIKTVDNHAHPLRYVGPGEKPDDEFDALPLDAIGPIPLPVRLNPGNLEFVGAWRDLYGYKHDDMSEAHVRGLLETKQRVAREQGEQFPTWAIDQAVVLARMVLRDNAVKLYHLEAK